MKTEFNLSDRIIDTSPEGYKETLSSSDVKEFIRLLKEEIKPFKELKRFIVRSLIAPEEKEAISIFIELDKKIDKLAGDKLK